MQEELILPEKQPLFELCKERLTHWTPADDAASEAVATSSCTYLIIIINNLCVRFV